MQLNNIYSSEIYKQQNKKLKHFYSMLGVV